MENIFFFQTQQIPVRNKSSHVASLRDSSSVFNQLKEQKIFYSYFQVDQNYYLFLFSQKSIDINFLYQLVEIIEELDSKQRKIRSFRGFFLYALEIMKTGKEYEILSTNLQPFFWKKVHNIIRQNKKSALQEFLFGKDQDNKSINQDPNPRIKILEDQIQSLQNQINFLQDRICDLETNSKYALKGTLDESDEIKTIQQGNSTLEVKKGPYLPENDSEVRNPTYQRKGMESKSISDPPKIDFQPLSKSEEYNLIIESRESA